MRLRTTLSELPQIRVGHEISDVHTTPIQFQDKYLEEKFFSYFFCHEAQKGYNSGYHEYFSTFKNYA